MKKLARRLWSKRTALLLVACLVAVGCWQIEKRVTLNPDGSAKIHVTRDISLDAVKQMMQMEQGDEKGGGMEAEAREGAASLVEDAQGVEAWKDVSWSVQEEVIRVEGTAYVPDVGDFSLDDPSEDNDTGFTALDYRRDGDEAVLEMNMGGADDEDEEPLPSSLTMDEAMKRAKKAKKESSQGRRMAAGMLIDMSETVKVALPAEPTKVEGFTKGEDGFYTAGFEGEKLLKALGAVAEMPTKELAEHLMDAASEGKTLDAAMGELMLDELEGVPARLVFPASGGAQFDYEAEAAAAAEAMPGLKERLGITGEGGETGGS